MMLKAARTAVSALRHYYKVQKRPGQSSITPIFVARAEEASGIRDEDSERRHGHQRHRRAELPFDEAVRSSKRTARGGKWFPASSKDESS